MNFITFPISVTKCNVQLCILDLLVPLLPRTPSPGSSIRTPKTGSKGTPVRVRSDIQTDRRVRQVGGTDYWTCYYFVSRLWPPEQEVTVVTATPAVRWESPVTWVPRASLASSSGALTSGEKTFSLSCCSHISFPAWTSARRK